MDARQWLAAYADRLGVAAPTDEELERIAAPVACWVSARAGVDPARALAAAREVGDDG
jgi:hypothetical protein